MGTLRQMEYLLAVVEEESFTRAAHRLSVSQATLSHQLKALEEAVGQPLVERLPGRVLPTQMGREYLPHAITALRSAAAARRAIMTGHDGEPVSLRLAVLPSLASGVLPGAIRAWRDAHPDAEVSMLEFLDGDRLPREMLRGVADLAVGPVPDGWPGEVYPLYREELVVVLPADDVCADATGTPLDLALLADRDWVLHSESNPLASLVLRACARAGFTPRAAVSTHHPAAAVRLAAAGLGPALVPRASVSDDVAVTWRVPRPEVGCDLAAYTRGPAAPHVMAFVRALGGTELGR
ncbi:LysR family transcriptional regulator [Streptomyces sp. RLB3-17]|uniref:LysR family transcriptional regulator n=1 Tax=Streptomyces sp. RLB3-17 TaxID=2594455 RepID=UPI0011621098|nr:LysR family transcriptional regulator [Streptomyces sp. RLB3-17]QDO44353.1 LysR family transcriptional regulator [Streptomyces sp. RLB3-17]